jgi:hypothetical protein
VLETFADADGELFPRLHAIDSRRSSVYKQFHHDALLPDLLRVSLLLLWGAACWRN